MIKQSRWRAKIVTSLLPQPSVLVKVQFFSSFRICHKGTIFFFLSLSRSILWKQLIRIFLRGQTVNLQIILKMAVSKSAWYISQDKRIGRRRNLSRYQMIWLSNKTVPEPVERRGLLSWYQRFLLSLEIYLGTVRGQFKPPEAFLLTARQYGEVVLPDDSTGHVLCSLARK